MQYFVPWCLGERKFEPAVSPTDGLGNVVAYLNRATGDRVAEFEYSPFGETVRAAFAVSGPDGHWEVPEKRCGAPHSKETADIRRLRVLA